ncbi:hypothetical protein H2198_003225 [Neophaeococcomyces mojaviensis]|uniref:Uncharacterized protein n=1 Tax=Neophaeococcomyces mojaviensis TaxID=3383035 RepID=A0ACC3AC28_9EURO|nr:hypothetical protein H2198_003225 [Knufia sp. JES_112]
MLIPEIARRALAGVLSATAVVNSTQICAPSAIPYPEIPGIQILDFKAVEVVDYSASVQGIWDSPQTNLTGLSFCNVTLTYTHPGQGDVINLQTWLPLKAWNGRFQGISGGGWITGWTNTLGLRVHQGYAASVTDGGHSDTDILAEGWALFKNGSVNTPLLEDFSYVALHELAVIGKMITKSYYGKPPSYSYWNGCSTGGRQGNVFAQRFPEDFDGIVAAAPAINWATFIVSEYWPQVVMNILRVYPELCEFNAITAAVVEACDGLDGVADGIVSAPGLCEFDPHSLVGTSYQCDGVNRTITKEAAIIAEQTWKGPFSPDGVNRRWYGLNKDASLWLLPGTKCEVDSTGRRSCTGLPFWVAEEWIRLFVINNATYDLTTLNYEQYDALFDESVRKFDQVISTANPDLSGFRARGGKMITWHGLSDPAIPTNGSAHYYQQVLQKDPKASDFFRYFEVPGTDHCGQGTGPYPRGVLDSLIAWVEKGQAPQTLRGEFINATTGQVEMRRDICQWPLVAKYIGGDFTQASSFVCSEGFF